MEPGDTRPMSARTILLSSLSGAAHAGATHMKTTHSPFVSSPGCVFHNSLGLCFFLQTIPRKPIWQGQVPWVCLPLRKFSFFMKLQIFYSWKEFSIPGQPQFVTRNRLKKKKNTELEALWWQHSILSVFLITGKLWFVAWILLQNSNSRSSDGSQKENWSWMGEPFSPDTKAVGALKNLAQRRAAPRSLPQSFQPTRTFLSPNKTVLS